MIFKPLSSPCRSAPHSRRGAAIAGKTKDEAGALACVNDKWEEKEPEKGHKVVDYAGRCVLIPDDPAVQKHSRTASETTSTCPTAAGRGPGPAPDYKGGDRGSRTWEEGSQLKEYGVPRYWRYRQI